MGLAAMYVRHGVVVSRQIDDVNPGPGSVQVEPAYTGICGTDLHIFHGEMDARVNPPAVLGHEMSGRVCAVGDGVEGWQVGDAVTVMPLDWDGTCPACLAGFSHLCHHLDFLGIDSVGAMQQRWTVPAGALVRLPDTVSLDAAALTEPTAVAVHDVRRAAIAPGEKALVVGGGPVGLLIAVVTRLAGADVVIVEPDAYRRSVSEDLAFRVLDPRSADVARAVGEWTGGAGVSVAFEVSGAAVGLSTAVDALAVRGRLCLVAIHSEPRGVNLHKFFWRELSLVGARLYERDDFARAVELIASGVIPTASLVSRVEPLAAASRAFEALEAGGSVMKVLIDCRVDSAPVAVTAAASGSLHG